MPRMIFDEQSVMDAGTMRRTSDGYLVAEFARVARTGIQEYAGREVGDASRARVRVYRPESEVFSDASIRSFAHRPLTDGHPTELVDAKNWKKYAVGHVDGEIMRDGKTVRVPLIAMDAATCDRAEKGDARELSVGYTCDLKFEDGVTPEGEKYDAVQRNIRVNHIAIVRKARGGEQLRIGDDRGDRKMDKTIIVDGVNLTLPETEAAVVTHAMKKLSDAAQLSEAEKKKLEEQLAEEKKKRETSDGKAVALEAQVKDAAITPDKLDALVAARTSLVGKARFVLGDSFDAKGKTDIDIRRLAVAKKLGDEKAKVMTDAGIEGAFEAVTADAPAGQGLTPVQQLGRQMGTVTTIGDAAAIRDKAWEDRGKEQRDAWRGATADAPISAHRPGERRSSRLPPTDGAVPTRRDRRFAAGHRVHDSPDPRVAARGPSASRASMSIFWRCG
jgi:hypothetical protein